MTLEDGTKGKRYQVTDQILEGVFSRRLEALGLTTGTKIEVLNNKRNGSIIFKVRGTRLAVGKKIAQSILIEEEN